MNAALIGLAAAAVAALASYLAASRKLSGKIGTSEASSLWAESKSIRDDYRERIATSERRTLALEERVAKLEGDNSALTRENNALVMQNGALERLVGELRVRLEACEAQNAVLRETVAELQETLRKERE